MVMENGAKLTIEQQVDTVCEPPPPRKAWFCSTLLSDGRTVRLEAASSEGFMDMLAQASVGWVDYSAVDFDTEVPAVAQIFGFSKALVNSIICEPSVNYQDFDTEMGLRLPSVRVAQFDVKVHPLLMLLTKNFVMTIHPQETDTRFGRLRRYSGTTLKRIPPDLGLQDKLTLLIIRIIDENNDTNFQYLRRIEEHGDELNKDLASPVTPREMLGPKIYSMKHALIAYMDALWETADVINALRFGDADLLSDDQRLLDRVGVLAANVGRQIGLAEHMSEVLASGLEVMQTIYNNQLQVLNNRLSLVTAWLTVLGTAVLVPNTLATIFSNSAFDLGPGDLWWYLTLLVVSTIVSTWLAFSWVKRRGLMPRKLD
ncbi:MAG: CorA family divalent cation transporter [Chloroflexota bacterium]